jgi:crotonobetainyl-CoA:carnitine CoA-transferase CaiB-like acyl-CoA transferase
MHLVAGILAKLIERGRTGLGGRVEVAMLDVCTPATGGMIVAAIEGRTLPRLGNRHPTACPSNTYQAADGQILVYCLTEDHWHRLARLMERTDLLEDSRYRDHLSRYAIIEEVDGIVGEWVAPRTREELVQILITNGIPCAPVRPITEVAADPELEQRGLIRDGEFDGQAIKILGPAIKLSGEGTDQGSTVVSQLGRETAEVLSKLGIGESELQALGRDGVTN